MAIGDPDRTCREILTEVEGLLNSIKTADGVYKIATPVNSAIKDKNFEYYATVKEDGEAHALMVGSNSLAKESGGYIQNIATYLQPLHFDGEYLKVKAGIEVSDIQIGAIEFKDATTDLRVNVTADGGNNALFVQSNSLLKKTDLEGVVGTAIVSPGANTLLARIKALEDVLGTNVATPADNTVNLRLKTLNDAMGTAVDSPAAYTLLARLKTIGAIDYAKESGGNLAAIAGKDFSTETTLASIKDSAGIKKITDPVVIGTGSNFIGAVGKKLKTVTPAMTVSTDPYADDDCIGGKLTLTDAMRISGGSGTLKRIIVTDSADLKATLDIIIFNANPTAATLTDQSAVDLSTDISKVISHINIDTTKYTSFAGVAIADVDVDRGVEAVGSANLYAAVVATGAHDYVAATDLGIKFVFEQN